LADRLEQALADDIELLALRLDDRALMLAALEDRNSSPSCCRLANNVSEGHITVVSRARADHARPDGGRRR
jgi:hypothetical protein